MNRAQYMYIMHIVRASEPHIIADKTVYRVIHEIHSAASAESPVSSTQWFNASKYIVGAIDIRQLCIICRKAFQIVVIAYDFGQMRA